MSRFQTIHLPLMDNACRCNLLKRHLNFYSMSTTTNFTLTVQLFSRVAFFPHFSFQLVSFFRWCFYNKKIFSGSKEDVTGCEIKRAKSRKEFIERNYKFRMMATEIVISNCLTAEILQNKRCSLVWCGHWWDLFGCRPGLSNAVVANKRI